MAGAAGLGVVVEGFAAPGGFVSTFAAAAGLGVGVGVGVIVEGFAAPGVIVRIQLCQRDSSGHTTRGQFVS